MCLAAALQWRHNECDGVSNHLRHDCLLKHLFRRRSKKTSKLRVTVLCERNSPVTGEIPVQRVSNAKNVSIWWRHHGIPRLYKWLPTQPMHSKTKYAYNHIWSLCWLRWRLFPLLPCMEYIELRVIRWISFIFLIMIINVPGPIVIIIKSKI